MTERLVSGAVQEDDSCSHRAVVEGLFAITLIEGIRYLQGDGKVIARGKVAAEAKEQAAG